MINWETYIPTPETLPFILAAIIFIWKLSPFLRAMREAASEEDKDGKRGKVSRKRIIPLMFAGTVCYMIIDHTRSPVARDFNVTAFGLLLLYIALDQTVVTVSQADGLLDRLSTLKSSAIKRESLKIETDNGAGKKTTEEKTVERSVATEVPSPQPS